ncbi:MAG: biotin/lipoyl-containing protein [Bacteroidota bacterium]
MSLEITIGKRTATLELLSKDKSFYTFSVDGKEYVVDVVPFSKGTYSMLYKHRSFYIELIEGKNSKQYFVNTKNLSYELEVIDAESRYLKNKNKGAFDLSENTIVSPMPGKVVKVLVSVGDAVQQGQTVIIVSAMKMESEYKVSKDGVVKEVLVSDGDTVDGNQTLIVIE